MEQTELEERYLNEVKIDTPATVFHEMRDIKNWDKEVFVAFYLNSQNKIISREIISIGVLDSILIHPREVFKTAIVRNAKSIIVAHNHPSGSLVPSDEDVKVTKHLRKAGDIIGISLLDHLIVGQDGFYSFNNENNDF